MLPWLNCTKCPREDGVRLHFTVHLVRRLEEKEETLIVSYPCSFVDLSTYTYAARDAMSIAQRGGFSVLYSALDINSVRGRIKLSIKLPLAPGLEH